MMGDYMHGKSGNTVMVNGMVNPVLPVRPGQVQRWRLLNSSNVRHYLLSLEGHTMYLVGTDGHLLDKPYARSQILLAPGERVEVLVKAGSTKKDYKLFSMPYAWNGNMASGQVTLLTLRVSGSPLSGAIPSTINPAAQRINPNNVPISGQHTLALSMSMSNGYINGQDFDVNPYTIMSTVGTYEIWTITNDSGMDHPFHQHVNPSQILAINGRAAAYPDYTAMPALKDVVLVPKMGSVTMLVPVRDYSGMAMFHCHILEHEDIGMMGMWHLMGM
jgi:FtsP/CotA-like multicopper oxidase with cupredoxin domain